MISYTKNLDTPAIAVLEAPTGYGKSISAPLISYIDYVRGFSHNFLHILPLRAIVTDLYLCTYILSLTGSGRLGGELCKDRAPIATVKSVLESMNISTNSVAYQMGDTMVAESIDVKKSPVFDARAVISTLDSFALNFLRVPVPEVFRFVKHYAIPRARIFTSSIVLDEAHMLMRYADEDAGRMLAFLKVLIEYVRVAKTPLYMLSATMGSWFEDRIAEWSGGEALFFLLGSEDRKNGNKIFVRDREYEEIAKSITWVTQVIDEGSVVNKVVDHVSKGERVLVVRDTVKQAIDLYSRLIERGLAPVVLHGQLSIEDRERAMKRASESKIVVATPVVEAGVNWDFDVGFRDATNAPSIIQVFGRVCRRRKDCTGHVYVIKPGEADERVYECARQVIEFLRGVDYVDWRIPYNYSRSGLEVKGYLNVLEKQTIFAGLTPDSSSEELFKQLISPLLITKHLLNEIIREAGYSLLREPLVQIYTNGIDGLRNSSGFDDLIGKSMTYTLDLVISLNRKRAVEGFACIGEGEGVTVDIAWVKPIDKIGVDDYYKLYRLYRDCLSYLNERMEKPLFIGFVVRRGAYKSGLGFI